MTIPQLVLKQELKQINLTQQYNPLILNQEIKQIVIQGGPIVANILPFSVTATTNGQTIFTLPYTYSTIICLFIMGTGQDILNGDYTVVGNIVTLGATAPVMQIGDLLYGAGQI